MKAKPGKEAPDKVCSALKKLLAKQLGLMQEDKGSKFRQMLATDKQAQDAIRKGAKSLQATVTCHDAPLRRSVFTPVFTPVLTPVSTRADVAR